MSRKQAVACRLPRSHAQLRASPPHTQDYLCLEFQNGISRPKKHLSREFLPVMKAIWPGDRSKGQGRWEVLRGLLVGVRQQLLRGCLTTGAQASHTSSHLYTQCLPGQEASEKGWIWIKKHFLPYIKKKNRHAMGNLKPGTRPRRLDLQHGACSQTTQHLSLDCFQRGRRRATKGPIILSYSSTFRWRWNRIGTDKSHWGW